MKKILTISVLFGLILAGSPVSAAVDRLAVTVGPSGQVVSIPAKAVEVAPGVFSLGTAIDPTTGLEVEGYAIIHRQSPKAKGGNATSGRGGKIACYSFLADGAKWKTLESWLVNTGNNESLSNETVFNAFNNGITTWEAAASRNILGVGSVTTNVLSADNTSPDGNNEAYFGAIAEPGVIGVTTVWGYFSGRTNTRELLEWDMVLNEVDFDWSSTGEANKMDLSNIVVHELGHAVGMADLYTDTCAEETMYGYAVNGETKKQSLNAGDIAGISKLYR